jgi:hypothetical protein
MPDMINPQIGIDIMNNDSIINRIIFAVTIFQKYHPFIKANLRNDPFSYQGLSGIGS